MLCCLDCIRIVAIWLLSHWRPCQCQEQHLHPLPTQPTNAPFQKRETCSGDGHLVATLAGGILTDSQSRTGYIASNFQFQFDAPPQAGAIYTAGFSACGNGSLALGGSAVWYECLSGDFYNLYDRNWAEQCEPVEIVVLPCGSASASQAPDGQVVGTQIVTTTIVSALSDGQPQVKTTTTGIPLCQVSQISDGKLSSPSWLLNLALTSFPVGQVQVGTTPCASITSTPAPAPATSTLAPVSQFSDGQIQVTPAASVPTVSSVPASATVVTLPSESVPVATGSTLATSPSPVSTSAAGGGSSPSATASASAAGTSAPASSGAGSVVGAGPMAALVVGILGAVAFL